ncbi:small metal-binding protein SmbP [Methylocystis parvus]|uniref:Small metal-binding protein n=1 Tax=Methylocystis parvus TaxID=134 RepID=A0A6B8M7U9_9HYPH|nr:small metal-binding protein SmbP [Methylocystis parvus]QGM98616.1 hypothetical protein F7D14_14770 [Methylocystis parvus]WBK01040.1 hypothetical protein MMG94_04800 [Methylocystis parvus OBBP]
MKKNAAALVGLVLAFAPIAAYAGIGAHLAAAIEHTEEAISADVKADTKEIAVHLRSALGHAREALHEKAIEADRAANRLIHAAIRLLKKAEARARFGDSAGAVKHSTDALAEMKKVK